jgi:hypothetical protein
MLLFSGGAAAAIIDGTSAGVIDFESPAYTLGPVPAPWSSSYAPVLITDSVPYAGSQCLWVGNTPLTSQGLAVLPITIAPTGVFTVTAKLRNPDYYPGANDPGFIKHAEFYVQNAAGNMEAGAVFDMRKPSGVPLTDQHRVIYLVGQGAGTYTVDGYFMPAAYHDVSITFDWNANTWSVTVTRPDSVSYTQSGTASGLALAELRFWGPQWQNLVTRVDDITYTPEPATLALLALGGAVLLRRRKAA